MFSSLMLANPDLWLWVDDFTDLLERTGQMLGFVPHHQPTNPP